MSLLRLICIVLLVAGGAAAESTGFTMVSGDPGMVDHWPGQDSYIGSADDYINGGLSTPHGSAPNSYGSYCYNAFNFYSGQTDPGIPSPYDAITFIEGSVDIDLNAVRDRIPQPWITGLTVTQGTLPFPSHANYSASFSGVNGWDLWSDHDFVLNVDFTANIGGTEDTSLGLVLEGEIWVIEAADFGTPTGHAYLDEVVIPRAIAQQASRLVYIMGFGTIPAAEGGSWGPMPMKAVVVGFTDAVAAGQSSWSHLRTLY